jgi:hypothetical protein
MRRNALGNFHCYGNLTGRAKSRTGFRQRGQAGKTLNDAAARIEGACIQLQLEEREWAREVVHRRIVEATVA